MFFEPNPSVQRVITIGTPHRGSTFANEYTRRRRGRRFFEVTDLIAPCVPVGLASGRVGNFINGELWGRAADPSLPWAMVFPQSGSPLPRHPSQIYQFLLEGLLLFTLLWLYARRPAAYLGAQGRPVWGKVSGAFLVGYGVLRFTAEYFREPDSFLGLLDARPVDGAVAEPADGRRRRVDLGRRRAAPGAMTPCGRSSSTPKPRDSAPTRATA